MTPENDSVKTQNTHYHTQLPEDLLAINNWEYFNEGGSTLVLSYTGFSSTFKGKVMSVFKNKPAREDCSFTEQEFEQFESAFRQYLPIPNKV